MFSKERQDQRGIQQKKHNKEMGRGTGVAASFAATEIQRSEGASRPLMVG